MDFKKLDFHSNNYLEKIGIIREDGKYYTFIKFLNYRKHKVELVRNKEQKLKEIYDNIALSRNGRDSFYFKVREKYGNITKEFCFDWLKKQHNYQMHLLQRREPALKPVAYNRINKLWQVDLIDMKGFGGPQNRNKKWIMTVIDVFSKYAFAEPMPNKSALTCRITLEKILDKGFDITEHYPTLVQSDNGPEFINAEFELLFDVFEITHVRTPTYMPQAQGAVERFNRTLKGLIFANMTRNGNKKWCDDLPILVKNYNNSYHSAVRDKPVNLHKYGKKNKKQIKLIAGLRDDLLKNNISYAPLKIGDKVRLHIMTNKETRKNIFRKKYVAQWSEKIYTVSKVIAEYSEKMKPKYEIKDGNKIIGKYYRHDLELIS